MQDIARFKNQIKDLFWAGYYNNHIEQQENGGVVGVAPDAQIFSMQVFGSI